jgi:2-C-methyl-D-erythritol 2,4-cyclodiphosphate synthase
MSTSELDDAPRIGVGLDSHRMEDGRRCILGGVEIPSDGGPVGHSDGDALLHALTDAVLGACGEGDIGDLFSPSDPRWKDADSTGFLTEALRRAAARGFRPASVDTVVVAERPRLGPWKERIRENLAAMLGLPLDRVGVKAKTAEGLGAIGAGRAIEAHAVVLLVRTGE